MRLHKDHPDSIEKAAKLKRIEVKAGQRKRIEAMVAADCRAFPSAGHDKAALSETKRFPAFWNGEETFASRVSGRWFVGGDVAPGDEDVLILLEKNGSPAWFKLRGSRLIFDDWEA